MPNNGYVHRVERSKRRIERIEHRDRVASARKANGLDRYAIGKGWNRKKAQQTNQRQTKNNPTHLDVPLFCLSYDLIALTNSTCAAIAYAIQTFEKSADRNARVFELRKSLHIVGKSNGGRPEIEARAMRSELLRCRKQIGLGIKSPTLSDGERLGITAIARVRDGLFSGRAEPAR